jgi:hypothetical protein
MPSLSMGLAPSIMVVRDEIQRAARRGEAGRAHAHGRGA